MKINLLFLILISVISTSKAQPKKPSLLGQWKEIEYHGNNGAEDFVQNVADGRTFYFEENNVFKDGLGRQGRYSIFGDSLHVILHESDSYFRFYENKKGEIALSPVTEKYEISCDEKCAFVFKKVYPSQKNASKKTDVISISYKQIGGEMGGYTNITLTKDSITGFFIGVENQKTNIQEKIQIAFWDSLTQSTNFKDFQAIKSTRSVTHIDGMDLSVQIETKDENYTFLNGEIDPFKNKNVYESMLLLEKKLRILYLRENPK